MRVYCSFYFLMAQYREMDEQMASLGIEEEKNENFTFEGDVKEEVNRYELCLVGRFLTEKSINLQTMKSKNCLSLEADNGY